MSGIMFDLDGTHFYHTRKNYVDCIDENYIKAAVLQYKNTDITDFVMSINGVISSVPSKIKTTLMEKYLKKEEMGQPVDYTEDACCKTAHHIWNVLGLDLYRIWIDTLREININPWFSFRMNDVHCQMDEFLPNTLISDFMYEHLDEHARIHGRKPEFYFDRARDWSLPEVRAEMYDFMQEQLEKYDIYGIVLDFQREFICFPPGSEEAGREIMTGFVRSVKELVARMEEKHGHKIKIALRCHPDPVCCFELGFDIIKYAREGLIDMYIASPRFRSTNNDMPIGLWKEILSPYNVELAGATERMVNKYPESKCAANSSETFNTVESQLGTAGYIFSQGADKLYVFNTFDGHDHMINESCKERNELYIPAEISDCDGTYEDGAYTLFSNAGSMEKISKRRRKCIVSYTDLNTLWKKSKGYLPLAFEKASQPAYLKINTGRLSDTDTVYLRLGIFGAANKLEVYINDNAVQLSGAEDCGIPRLTGECVYTYPIAPDMYRKNSQVVELIYRGDSSLTVDYADITIIPGDGNEK